MAEPWELYDRHVEHWRRSRRSPVVIEGRWIEAFTDLLPLGGSVLDLGCGHGDPIARHLLGLGYAVTGVDRAPGMVQAAQRALPAGAWLCADLAEVELDARFDGLVLWHSLFHLTPDRQREAFKVLARHAQPRSVLLFTTGPAASIRYGKLNGDPLYHASLDPEDYIGLLEQARFEVLDHVSNDPECGDATVWLARQLS